MTADERLAQILIKVERAKKHHAELQEEVVTYLASQPYTVHTKRHPATQHLIYYVSAVRQPPAVIAAIIGDILQNLRSTLDHLAYHLVDIGTAGKGPFRHTYFPIAETEAKYKTDAPQRIKGMRTAAIAAINALKPHGGGNDLFWQLHQLNNIDKHRLVLTVGSAFRSLNVGRSMHKQMQQLWSESGFGNAEDIPVIDLFLAPKDRMFPLMVGAELYTDLPDAVPDETIQFVFELAFGEPTDVSGASLGDILGGMIALVEKTVLNFKPYLV